MTRSADLPLRGAGGEPVDFARTIVSHGVAELPPNHLDLDARTLETTLPVPGGARAVRLTAANGDARVELVAGRAGQRTLRTLTSTVEHMLRLDEDLSWCELGAGRMLRAPTVFEDVVKTT